MDYCPVVSDSTAASNGVTPQLFPGNSRHTASTTSNTRADSQSLASERRAADVLHLSSECEGVGGGWEGGGTADDLTDGRSGERVKKKKKKRPPSGYDLPEVTTCNLVSDLGHEDDRYNISPLFPPSSLHEVILLPFPSLLLDVISFSLPPPFPLPFLSNAVFCRETLQCGYCILHTSLSVYIKCCVFYKRVYKMLCQLGLCCYRLRGAVYFGYGVMNIVLSLIPPKLMKLANLFGFSGNRRLGLQALEFASHSRDMKAPLARLYSRQWDTHHVHYHMYMYISDDTVYLCILTQPGLLGRCPPPEKHSPSGD